jgi:serine/threonine-protein kinase
MAQQDMLGGLIGDRYRLDRHIARGGMAEVWLASDTKFDRQVAVKILRPHLAGDATLAERFRREAVACAGITHPNIVAVYDCIEHRGQQAVIMQYVKGKSLRDVLDRQKKLGPQLTIHIGMSVAAALDEAHGKHIIHRDIKPGNILMTPEGRVLLTDFGIAKALDSKGDDLTSDNIMMGTAKYLSPEQVRGKPLDGRADLYGLGLVLYECLAGRVPFLGETDADTALARLQREPTDLARLRPSLSPQLVKVIMTLLARNPDHRYPTGAATRAALQSASLGHLDQTTELTPPAGNPTVPTDTTPPVVTRPPAVSNKREGRRLLAVLMALGVAATAVLWSVSRPDSTPAIDDAPETLSAPVGPVAISTITSYDPNGDDGEENEALTPLLLDGNPETVWTSTCYANQFFGSKEYVGLVVQLNQPATGTLQIAMANAPWTIEVYQALDTAPFALVEWGERTARKFNTKRRGSTFAIDSPAQYFLVVFREAGRGPSCSSTNPYQTIVSGVSFQQG